MSAQNKMLSIKNSAPMKGLSGKSSGGFLSPNSMGRRSSLLGGSGTSIGGTPNRMNNLKKEGGIKVSGSLFEKPSHLSHMYLEIY